VVNIILQTYEHKSLLVSSSILVDGLGLSKVAVITICPLIIYSLIDR
jgi:hypothetical protein